MHETIQTTPALLQLAHHVGDLIVFGDVHFKADVAAEFFGKLNDTVVEAFADISKGELSTFAMAGSGDAVGDRTVRQHARDQKFLALQKSHDLFLGKDFLFFSESSNVVRWRFESFLNC